MPVGMPYVTFPHAPWFIRRRPGHDEALFQSEFMSCINLSRRREKPTHPHTACIVIARVPRHWPTARPLSVFAEKNFAVATAHAAKTGWLTPFPTFLPTKFLEPGETLLNVGDVQNRDQALDLHGLSPPYL